MKDEDFKRLLSEVAEWKIPDTPRETSLNAKKKRGRKSAEEEYQELREEMFYEEFGGVNPTYPPMIVKLKIKPETCNDCGRYCEQGRTVECKQHESNKKLHWRRRCITCNRWEDPYTKQFTVTNGTESSIIWNSFCRDSKGTYNSKGNKLRFPVASTEHKVIENDQERITFYQEKNKPE